MNFVFGGNGKLPRSRLANAVEQQVVRGDRGCHIRAGLLNEGHALFRHDVLEHHAKVGKQARERREMALKEHRLTVEDVHAGIGSGSKDWPAGKAARIRSR